MSNYVDHLFIFVMFFLLIHYLYIFTSMYWANKCSYGFVARYLIIRTINDEVVLLGHKLLRQVGSWINSLDPLHLYEK